MSADVEHRDYPAFAITARELDEIDGTDAATSLVAELKTLRDRKRELDCELEVIAVREPRLEDGTRSPR